MQAFDCFHVGGNVLEVEIVAGIHAESDFPRQTRDFEDDRVENVRRMAERIVVVVAIGIADRS